MPSKTSFSETAVRRRTSGGWFNGELFRRNLSRFWPLWALYAAVWIIALPLMQGAMLFGPAAKHTNHVRLAAQSASEVLNVASTFTVVVCAIFGCLFAMVLCAYLCQPKSAGAMHSLPIRREGLFLTNYLSGIAVFLLVNVLTLLITAAVQGAGRVLVWGNLGKWFACATGEMLFFFSFAVLCAMFTGQILAIPVFYTIFNFLAVTLCVLVQYFADILLYGYNAGNLPVWVQRLTPILSLYRDVHVNEGWRDVLDTGATYTFSGLGTVGIFALVGLVFAALALLIYRRRKSESAGDTVAVRWAKPIFRYGVGVCCALSLGMGLYALIWDQLRNGVGYSLIGALTCMALAGVVGYFAAEMLLQKSFRVWKQAWKGAAVLVAFMVVFGICLSLDVTGVERRVPALNRVESLEVSFGGQNWTSSTIRDPDTISAFQTVHQKLIDDKAETLRREETDAFTDDATYTYEYGSIYLNYHLNNGNSIRRYYSLYYTLDELQQPDSAVAQLAKLATDPEVQSENILDGYRDIQRFTGGYFSYVLENDPLDPDGPKMQNTGLDAATAQALYAAIQKDIAAGNFGRNTFDPEAWSRETYVNTLSLYGITRRTAEMEEETVVVDLEFSANASNLIAALKQYGLVSDSRPLLAVAEQSNQNAYVRGADVESADTVPAEPVLPAAAASDVDIDIVGGADGPTYIYGTSD